MEVTLELKGPFGRIFGVPSKKLGMADQANVGQLREQLKTQVDTKYNNLISTSFVFRNGSKLSDDIKLADGDVLSMLMAIFSGG